MQNGERGVRLYSIIIHETKSGYAQCFREDIENENMGKIELEKIKFSDEIRAEWEDEYMFEKMLCKAEFVLPKEC